MLEENTKWTTKTIFPLFSFTVATSQAQTVQLNVSENVTKGINNSNGNGENGESTTDAMAVGSANTTNPSVVSNSATTIC